MTGSSKQINETVKSYLAEHWVPMAISMASTVLIFIASVIALYTNFRLDYFSLTQKVNGNSSSIETINGSSKEVLERIIRLEQKEEDNQQLLITSEKQIEDIHDYLLRK